MAKKQQKRDRLILIFSIIGIVALLALLFNINRIFETPSIDTSDMNQAQPEAIGPEPAGNSSLGSEMEQCVQKRGADPESVVFVYSNSCPHCQTMKPRVKQLESQGYNFHWAESSDSRAQKLVRNCFRNMIRGVPTFVCPSNGETKVGAVSQEALQDFADNCK